MEHLTGRPTPSAGRGSQRKSPGGLQREDGNRGSNLIISMRWSDLFGRKENIHPIGKSSRPLWEKKDEGRTYSYIKSSGFKKPRKRAARRREPTKGKLLLETERNGGRAAQRVFVEAVLHENGRNHAAFGKEKRQC